jgi:hypothetical protein
LAVVVALVAVLLVPTSVAVVALAGRPDRSDVSVPARRPAAGSSTTTPSTAPPELSTTTPSTAPQEASAATTAPSPVAGPAPDRSVATTAPPSEARFAYQPLFPFRSSEEARAWQKEVSAGGHQPWHADPEQTALAFVGYLGYPGIDRITSHTGDDRDAEIGVGYKIVEGRTGTAAIVHLVRFGTGGDAPWEVVGTADTDLTLTALRYGATVTSPMTVGGRITGVDEALRVQVRQLSSAGPLGESCCQAAGGEGSPWHASVSFSGATDTVLTVSVSTGGHLQAVERFAVTGVRVS